MALTTLTHITYFVGIDISKQQLDCWVRPLGQYLCCNNGKEGFQRLHQWLMDRGCGQENTILCLEHTGMYGKRLLGALNRRGWKCSLEKTTILDKVAPEHHRKDDRFDARLLAEYADRFTDQLNVIEPAEPEIDQMRQLYSERRRLVRQRSATKTKQTQAKQEPNCPQALQFLPVADKYSWRRPGNGMDMADHLLRTAKVESKAHCFSPRSSPTWISLRKLGAGENPLLRSRSLADALNPDHVRSISQYPSQEVQEL